MHDTMQLDACLCTVHLKLEQIAYFGSSIETKECKSYGAIMKTDVTICNN